MTEALTAIIESVEAAGFEYEVGFGADILEWIETAKVPSQGTVLISIGPEVPTQKLQTGKVRLFRGTYTVWMRMRVAKGKEAAAYQRYRDLRESLNGKPYDGGRHVLSITESSVDMAGGFAEPQLTIEAIV